MADHQDITHAQPGLEVRDFEPRHIVIPASIVEALAVEGGTVSITFTRSAGPAGLQRVEELLAESRERVRGLEAGSIRRTKETLDRVSEVSARVEELRTSLRMCDAVDEWNNACQMSRFEGEIGRCARDKCPHRPPVEEGDTSATSTT